MDFLEDNDFDAELSTEWVRLGNHTAAADIMVRIGRRPDALNILSQSTKPAEKSKAARYLMDTIFSLITFGSLDAQHSDDFGKLLALRSQFELSREQINEVHSPSKGGGPIA